VPRFPELVEEHGAWLASKFRVVIQTADDVLPSDLVVVCPAEKGSKAFTEFLRAVFGVTVIRVPRPVLDVFNSKKSSWRRLLDRFVRARPDWHIRISSVHSGRIVLMDEFNASGGTRQQLTDFAHHFGQEVYCYFSIADWNPSGPWLGGAPTYALYDFQALGETPSGGRTADA
jgi:hypothetical protein